MDSKKLKLINNSKSQFLTPTREEYFDFLIRCYFGEGDNPLKMAIDRAYLDLNRTLHGFANHRGADSVRDGAHKLMISMLKRLQRKRVSQISFDKWHFKSCEALRNYFWQGGFRKFSYGQSQKWINMTLKYIFTMGEKRLPGYATCYPFAHIPIDNIFIDSLQEYKKVKLPAAWSRMDDYGVYLQLQKEFRSIFPDSIPLDVEFRLWISHQTLS